MFRYFIFISLFAALVIATVFVSCGSNWTITGNSLIITPLENDSIIPAGSYVITPVDSL